MQERVVGKLIYASNMSLDGCTEDERGAFDWAPPDDDVFVFVTGLMGSAGTYLYRDRDQLESVDGVGANADLAPGAPTFRHARYLRTRGWT